ncbi:hypothetical protein ACFWIY_18205 [Streptomyces sioyaensis]|uniref:hypothetical protein n=1 Tax=Streptomyces sioyaensis TaxID=67364 RepID=UPI0036489ECB
MSKSRYRDPTTISELRRALGIFGIGIDGYGFGVAQDLDLVIQRKGRCSGTRISGSHIAHGAAEPSFDFTDYSDALSDWAFQSSPRN